MQGVTQVPTQDSVEGSIPNPQPLQVQYDFKGVGVPVTSACIFGNGITRVDENGISEVKAMLSSHFSVKDLGPAKYFLGMSIS